LNSPDRKAALRAQFRARLAAEPPDRRVAQSALICARLQETDPWRSARAILFYAPLAMEADVWPLLDAARDAGKTVTLPRFEGPGRGYVAAIVTDSGTDLQPGAFGVREPPPGSPVFPLYRLDLVLVPGIAFDWSGRRLGRGKGFYDRLLARVSGVKCGVAFDWQLTGELPAEPHDAALDCIVTPTQWVVVRTPRGF
jgi:5-formyltetrahydrofolate cyclo-ligase